MITRKSGCCGSMPPVITRSAQSDLRVGQFLGVAVDEPDVPVLRQHRRDRDQAERRRRVCAPTSSQASVKFHIEFVELREHHQHAAGTRSMRAPGRVKGPCHRRLCGL